MKKAKPHDWTDEQKDYMKKIIPGRSRKKIHEMFNNKFNLDLTFNQVVGFMKRNNLKTGFDGRFVKGQEVWNKGIKGLVFEGSEKGWFKKGQVPSNYRPVGSERIDSKDGYVIVKVSDEGTYKSRWRHKHVVEWEKNNGTVPDNHVVSFLDSDRTNSDIENLMLLSRRQLALMNKYDLFSDDPEVTKTGITLVSLMQKINDFELYDGDFEKVEEYIEKAEIKGIKRETLLARLRRGWKIKDAINSPLNSRPYGRKVK